VASINGKARRGTPELEALIQAAGFSTLRLVEKKYPTRNTAQSHLPAFALPPVFASVEE